MYSIRRLVLLLTRRRRLGHRMYSAVESPASRIGNDGAHSPNVADFAEVALCMEYASLVFRSWMGGYLSSKMSQRQLGRLGVQGELKSGEAQQRGEAEITLCGPLCLFFFPSASEIFMPQPCMCAPAP